MTVSQETLDEAAEALARAEAARGGGDRRAEVCGCGHPVAKHVEGAGGTGSVCLQGRGWCPCREVRPVAKVPNARVFGYKSDESGHAIVKGIGKVAQMGLGHRFEWLATCTECEAAPVTVVTEDGGKTNEPRCGVHR